ARGAGFQPASSGRLESLTHWQAGKPDLRLSTPQVYRTRFPILRREGSLRTPPREGAKGESAAMYESHFGLRERPFRSLPDASRYSPATGHEQALAQLLRGLEEEEGLLLLSGGPGLGKTLLCHCLLQRAGETARSAFLTNSHLPGRAALLQAILYELALPHEGRGEQELRLSLTDDLLSHCASTGPTLLVVD